MEFSREEDRSGLPFPSPGDLLNSGIKLMSPALAGGPGLISGSGIFPGEGRGYPLQYSWVFPGSSVRKENTCNVGDLGSITGLWEDPLEKGTTTHFSILAWRIPWTVQSKGSQRVGHD